jgi:hypothetical protein
LRGSPLLALSTDIVIARSMLSGSISTMLNTLFKCGEPTDELEFWCATARAVIEILRGTREGGEAAH